MTVNERVELQLGTLLARGTVAAVNELHRTLRLEIAEVRRGLYRGYVLINAPYQTVVEGDGLLSAGARQFECKMTTAPARATRGGTFLAPGRWKVHAVHELVSSQVAAAAQRPAVPQDRP